MKLEYSFIIPIFNEEENIPELLRRMFAMAAGLTGESEFIFIDDGSRDRGPEMLKETHQKDPRVKLVRLSRNFGHQEAVTTGLRFAEGEIIIVTDADLQDPPEVIPKFIDKLKQGCDVVYAVRTKRKEDWFLRLCFSIFYRVLSYISAINIPLDSGDFCVMNRRVVDQINNLPERERFVRGLRAWVGFRQEGMEYERNERHAGETKYRFWQRVHQAFDWLIAFSTVPLRLSTYLGLILTVIGGVYASILIYLRITNAYHNPGFAALACLIIAFGGVQLISIGILGEYIGSIYYEVKKRPVAVVADTIGWDKATLPSVPEQH